MGKSVLYWTSYNLVAVMAVLFHMYLYQDTFGEFYDTFNSTTELYVTIRTVLSFVYPYYVTFMYTLATTYFFGAVCDSYMFGRSGSGSSIVLE